MPSLILCQASSAKDTIAIFIIEDILDLELPVYLLDQALDCYACWKIWLEGKWLGRDKEVISRYYVVDGTQ